MTKKWLGWINLAIGIAIAILLLATGIYALSSREEIAAPETLPKKPPPPKNAFSQQPESYNAIGEPILHLPADPISMQLPDLRRYLVYYGRNSRPDAPENPMMHFAFTGNKNISSVAPGEKLYLVYDRSQTPPQYIFSPGNAETSLWIEPSIHGNEALIKVGMKNDNGQIIREPAHLAQFTLIEKEYVRFGGPPWELGKYRVDATLLARQRARWYGPDLFLQRHGGKEYEEEAKKQRIDFGEGEDIYSVYVGSGDCLIWEGERWKVVKPGPESLGKPLMAVKKVEERLMTLELWDPEGKGKVVLNLLKSTETNPPQQIQQTFKFVGAKTRSQYVFEINKQRMTLSPKDWLLLTPKGWKKLVTTQEIDDYVERKITGILFVFDGIEKKGEQQVVKGVVFNPARTDMQNVEIPIQQGMGPKDKKETQAPAHKEKAGEHGSNMRNPMPMNQRLEMERRRQAAQDDDLDDDDDEDDEDFDDDL